CRIAQPDIGVLTLIAPAHTEGVGGLEGVAREKGAIFSAREGMTAVGNGDDPRVRVAMERSSTGRRLLYGHAGDALVRIVGRDRVGMTRPRLPLTRRGEEPISFETPLLGEAGALATAAAVAIVALAMEVPVDSRICAEAFAGIDVGAGAG